MKLRLTALALLPLGLLPDLALAKDGRCPDGSLPGPDTARGTVFSMKTATAGMTAPNMASVASA